MTNCLSDATGSFLEFGQVFQGSWGATTAPEQGRIKKEDKESNCIYSQIQLASLRLFWEGLYVQAISLLVGGGVYRGDCLISLFGLAWGYIDCQDDCSEQTSEDRLFNGSDPVEMEARLRRRRWGGEQMWSERWCATPVRKKIMKDWNFKRKVAATPPLFGGTIKLQRAKKSVSHVSRHLAERTCRDTKLLIPM